MNSPQRTQYEHSDEHTDKNSAAEGRTLLKMQNFVEEDAERDVVSKAHQFMLYANPTPAASKDGKRSDEFSQNQPPRSLKKVPLKKRATFTLKNLLAYYDLTFEMRRKLNIGESNPIAWYFHKGVLVPASVKKDADDLFNSRMKMYNDGGQNGPPPVKEEFKLMGSQEIEKMRKTISDDITDVVPSMLGDLWVTLKGPKSSFVYNPAEIKVVKYNRDFVGMCCRYIKHQIEPIQQHFNAVYSDFVKENITMYEEKTSKRGERVAVLALKMMDSVIAKISRINTADTEKKVADIISSKITGAPFGKISELNQENLKNSMIEAFSKNRIEFYSSMLELVDLLIENQEKTLVRYDLIKSFVQNQNKYDFDSLNRAIDAIASNEYMSTRMVTSFFTAVNVENLSKSANSRKKLPEGFEMFFMNNFAQKMFDVNANEKDKTKITYVVSEEGLQKLSGDLRKAYEGRILGYHPAHSQDNYGYEQKFTMSLNSAAKIIDGKKTVPLIDGKEDYLANIDSVILAVGLYKQFKLSDIKKNMDDKRLYIRKTNQEIKIANKIATKTPAQNAQSPVYGNVQSPVFNQAQSPGYGQPQPPVVMADAPVAARAARRPVAQPDSFQAQAAQNVDSVLNSPPRVDSQNAYSTSMASPPRGSQPAAYGSGQPAAYGSGQSAAYGSGQSAYGSNLH